MCDVLLCLCGVPIVLRNDHKTLEDLPYFHPWIFTARWPFLTAFLIILICSQYASYRPQKSNGALLPIISFVPLHLLSIQSSLSVPDAANPEETF